jgi:hypothetical protein
LTTAEVRWAAWLHVRPVVDANQTWDSMKTSWEIGRETAHSFRAPTAFVVRYTRLSSTHLQAEERGELDTAMRAEPAEDWQVFVPDLDRLERVLAAHLEHLEALRIPVEVAYPEPPSEFARARTLDDVLGAA